ncbi:unnamed protein product [Fructobacillus evanidus]|uniref:Uncharacterized protein n=1 Tax=Fructobacillus evanidus TaxID=3064281 RepID=A0ABM9MY16_9LACO|nr:unnamed protein product [Fructobacillus sp. LMG 32999]CAK1247514.1 unnamed protein product [Fructobacillus sp. LMG 32999]CAK1248338.1 unnamed protein product [Fructobacillus sp. LMG 32999]CAK1248843.1 unnamed protein product [Fructobacillus sp. LMG 32999]CAK1254099.1 unnamed protein product [Fructobacillus sp. LMG 32999]
MDLSKKIILFILIVFLITSHFHLLDNIIPVQYRDLAYIVAALIIICLVFIFKK